MKRRFALFSLLLCFSCFGLINAQETIIEVLETSTAGEGKIEILSEPAITALLGKSGSKVKSDSGNFDIVKMNGYRIQVFMGNDPKKSRTEAFNKQNAIKAVFSDMETYVNYDAPNWKVMVGDFITREEATLFMEKMQKEFAQFGKEMYIVGDKINVFIEK